MGLCLFWSKLEEVPFQKETLRTQGPPVPHEFCFLSVWEAIWAIPLPQDKAVLQQDLGSHSSHPHSPQDLHLLSGVGRS